MKVPISLVDLKQFRPGKLLSLFFLVFFLLFISLGIWQLNRASEKTQLAKQVNASTLAYSTDRVIEPYQSYRIMGRFLAEPVFYMDNRTYKGQAGYEAWAFFETANGTWLVSVGWLAGGESRSQIPSVTLNQVPMAIDIMVRPDSENPLYGVEVNQSFSGSNSAWLVQSLTQSWLNTGWPNKAILGLAQLHDSQVFGVGPSVWQPSFMTIEKHLGYAFQWFGMSIALLCMFLYAGAAKKDEYN